MIPDGRFWTFGGLTDASPVGVNQPTAELLPHNGAPVPVPLLLQTDQQNLYPFAYIIPGDSNRAVSTLWLYCGVRSQLLNIVTLAFVAELPQLASGTGHRSYPLYGSSVMLPVSTDQYNNPLPAEILICGGGSGFLITDPALDNCGRTTPSLGAGAIWTLEQMPIRRVLPDLITLPDGNVLIINGAGNGGGGFNAASVPIRTAVLYDPRKVKCVI